MTIEEAKEAFKAEVKRLLPGDHISADAQQHFRLKTEKHHVVFDVIDMEAEKGAALCMSPEELKQATVEKCQQIALDAVNCLRAQLATPATGA